MTDAATKYTVAAYVLGLVIILGYALSILIRVVRSPR